MSIIEFAQWAGIGRTLVYQEIGEGRLAIHKVGRRTIISYADAEEWLKETAVVRGPTIDDASRKTLTNNFPRKSAPTA
jgi:excisionase family DNA binding protein